MPLYIARNPDPDGERSDDEPERSADGDGERDRKLHEDRYDSSQDRRRDAKLHHLTYGARIVSHLSPAENQKQRR